MTCYFVIKNGVWVENLATFYNRVIKEALVGSILAGGFHKCMFTGNPDVLDNFHGDFHDQRGGLPPVHILVSFPQTKSFKTQTSVIGA